VNRIRVVFADDHEPMHALVRRLIEPEFEVVQSVLDGQSLVEAAFKLRVEVLVVDIGMPVKSGIQAVREILQSSNGRPPRVVFFTSHNDPALVDEALQLGAVGYVLKQSALEHLVPALHAVMRGDVYLSPGVEPMTSRG